MIFIIWGEDKSCKNTLALSFPKPLVDMEFDIGGLERSARNLPHLPIEDWINQGLITKEEYIIPPQYGDFDPVKGTIRPSKVIVGMKELFYQFTARFLTHLKNPNLQSIMVDTGTLLYEITCTGYLQELQEKQLADPGNTKPIRTSLQPIEYREPYIRMRGFIYQAKAHRKNLILTHHATDEYGMVIGSDGRLVEGKTGKRVLHGWGQLGDGADIIAHTYWDSKKDESWCDIELAEVKELERAKFQNPTYEDISKAISLIKTSRAESRPVISDNLRQGMPTGQVENMIRMMEGNV